MTPFPSLPPVRPVRTPLLIVPGADAHAARDLSNELYDLTRTKCDCTECAAMLDRLQPCLEQFANLTDYLMGSIKNYLLTVITACAPEDGFAQDAIEYALVSDLIPLTYHPGHDVCVIMGQYDKIIDNYRAVRRECEPLLALPGWPDHQLQQEAA